MKLLRNFLECFENFSKIICCESIGVGREIPNELYENSERIWKNFAISETFCSISLLPCTDIEDVSFLL